MNTEETLDMVLAKIGPAAPISLEAFITMIGKIHNDMSNPIPEIFTLWLHQKALLKYFGLATVEKEPPPQ